MTTVFIGGSRHISRFPPAVMQRLDGVMSGGHEVVIGDANGADKAAQKHLVERRYENVTVFCSAGALRNNLGHWPVRQVNVPKGANGFQFHAAKDRQMAREADFGLMIWDGKSPGTVLNVLRLMRRGKTSVLLSVPDRRIVNIKTAVQWHEFLETCPAAVRESLRDRATPEEWDDPRVEGLLTASTSSNSVMRA